MNEGSQFSEVIMGKFGKAVIGVVSDWYFLPPPHVSLLMSADKQVEFLSVWSFSTPVCM